MSKGSHTMRCTSWVEESYNKQIIKIFLKCTIFIYFPTYLTTFWYYWLSKRQEVIFGPVISRQIHIYDDFSEAQNHSMKTFSNWAGNKTTTIASFQNFDAKSIWKSEKYTKKEMDFDRSCHFWHHAIIKKTFKALKRRKKLAINGSIGKSSEQKSSKFTKPLPAVNNSVFMICTMNISWMWTIKQWCPRTPPPRKAPQEAPRKPSRKPSKSSFKHNRD